MESQKKTSQIVVRITPELEKKLLKAATKCGLTKASWVRQLVISNLVEQTK